MFVFLQFCYIFKIPCKGHSHKPTKFHFTILQALESLSNVFFVDSVLNSNAHACTVHMSSSLHVCGRGRKWLSANAHMLQPEKLTCHDNFVWHSLFPPPSHHNNLKGKECSCVFAIKYLPHRPFSFRVFARVTGFHFFFCISKPSCILAWEIAVKWPER